MTPTDIINTRIERAIKELADIDFTIAQSSGQVSVGFRAIKEMSVALKANAQRAIHSPAVSDRDIKIHDAICGFNKSIQDVATEFGVGRSTVRRAMDRVTENNQDIRTQQARA